jgi:hypothetical protein
MKLSQNVKTIRMTRHFEVIPSPIIIKPEQILQIIELEYGVGWRAVKSVKAQYGVTYDNAKMMVDTIAKEHKIALQPMS